MPNEKPILFNSDMVQAILDGRKTETRRVINPQPIGFCLDKVFYWDEPDLRDTVKADPGCWYYDKHGLHFHKKCLYGSLGDQLWVRETWQAAPVHYDDYNGGNEAGYPYDIIPKNKPSNCWITYAADGDEGPWRPSIHMPRWASRITLEIEDIRVERVQDITPDGIYSEGFPISVGDDHDCSNAYEWFSDLWDSINAERGLGWEADPWVWVVKFRKLDQ